MRVEDVGSSRYPGQENSFHGLCSRCRPSGVEQQVLVSLTPHNFTVLENQNNIHSAHTGPDNSVNSNVGQQNAFNKENNPAPVAITDAATANPEEAAINEEWIENADPVDTAILEPQFISTGLEAYLKKNSIGKEILKHYKKCVEEKHPLSRNIRSKLTRLVIQREKDWALRDITSDQILDKFIITSERFMILAEEIARIFKYETIGTYYTPFKKVGEQSILPSGKLWHHYNYIKCRLQEASLLVRKEETETDIVIVSNSEMNKINWLSSNIDPWTDVLQYWNETYAARRTLYLLNKDFSVQDYFDKFKCLSTQEGKDLFLLDFARLHPNKEYIGDDEWEKIKNILIFELTKVTVKNPVELGYINCLNSGDLNKEKQNFLLLFLLPHLLPPKRTGRKRKQTDEVSLQNNQPVTKLSGRTKRIIYSLRTDCC